VYLDGKEVAHNYDSMESHTVPVELVAGKEYDFAFETSNAGARRVPCQMFWKTPEIFAREAKRPSQDRRHGPFICRLGISGSISGRERCWPVARAWLRMLPLTRFR